jgi:hypothetical protein
MEGKVQGILPSWPGNISLSQINKVINVGKKDLHKSLVSSWNETFFVNNLLITQLREIKRSLPGEQKKTLWQLRNQYNPRASSLNFKYTN